MDAIAPVIIESPFGPAMSERKVRMVGAALAASIAFALSYAGWLVARDAGASLGLVGLPVVTLLAWSLAPGTARATGSRVAGRVLGLTIATIVIADVVVVLFLVVSTSMITPDEWSAISVVDSPTGFFPWLATLLAMTILYWLAGLVFFGIPAMAIVLPAAALWAVLLRIAVNRPAKGSIWSQTAG